MAGDVIVRSSSAGLRVNDGPSVLGQTAARIPVGGKIRPGIKVLTSSAKSVKGAQEVYDEGVSRGLKWGDIENILKKRFTFERSSPMTPKNVRYFSVFRDDFTLPEAADQLLELYGEEFEGKKRLLRFPVVFPTDSWQANLPHALQTFTANELVYESDFDQAGNRLCFTKKAVEVNQQSKRAVRKFGGRDRIPRPDNGGICNPESCPQYQEGKCNLKGSLLFYVPGIPGSSVMSLPLTSFYGMEQARQTMAMVAHIRGGRISGTHNGKPIFYITKTLTDVAMLDRETGKPKRVPHWIVNLEANIDMLQVFQDVEQRQALSVNGGAAALALSAPEVEEPSDHDDDDHDVAIAGEVLDAEAPKPEPVDPRAAILALRADVAELLTRAGITPEVFSGYMAIESKNPSWGKEAATLTQAKQLLTEALAGDIKAWKSARNLDAPF